MSDEPIRGAGYAAARTAASAARLVADVARASEASWEGARGAAAQASVLADRLDALAEVDAEAFHSALTALGEGSPDLAARMEHAAAVPLEIATTAADVADAAALVAERCDGLVRADAAGAAALAAGASLAAAQLVRANLLVTPGDARVSEALRAAEDARESARRSFDAGP
jgi:formiminotetrahydrofolate cyclodeaminase